MATFRDLTTTQLKQAVRLREQIEELQARLDALLGGTAPNAKPDGPVVKLTKAGDRHRKIDAAPEWRLAHVKSPLDTLMDAAPKKGGLTPEGKSRIAAAMKAR